VRKDENNLDPKAEKNEKVVERSLRPQKLEEFIGQEGIKEQLAIFLTAGNKRSRLRAQLFFYVAP
jgi:holliday junction DNA helicase RuvB